MCVFVGECAPECSCLQRPEAGIGCLELELQAVVNHLTWMLGTDHLLL